MSWFKPQSLLDTVFEGSLILKGLSAVFELSGGLLLLFVSSSQIMRFANFVTQEELFEDPHDLLARLFNSTAMGLANSHTYAIVFLLSHAAIKFVIVFGLLLNKRWAYPFSFVALGLMITYQLYQLVLVKFGFGMLFLTAFDLFIVWLIRREYLQQQTLTSGGKSMDS